MSESLQDLWRRFRSLQFDSSDLLEFLESAHATLDPNSIAGQFGRTLVYERIEKRPVPINLEEARNHPTTRRIDGILPLLIPSCRNVEILVSELLEESYRNGLKYPIKDRLPDFRRDLAVCYLAVLHGRTLRSSNRLGIKMRVQCPSTALSGQSDRIMVRGALPLGGTATLFTTHLRACDVSQMTPSDLGYLPKMEAKRAEDGVLWLSAKQKAS